LWDFLERANAAKFLDIEFSGLRFFGVSGEIHDPKGITINQASQTDGLIEAKFDVVELVDDVRTFSQRKWYIVVELQRNDLDVNFDTIYIPVKVAYSEQLGAQNIVIPYTESEIPLGKFVDAFGDLYEVTKGLESLNFSDLMPYLRQQRDRSSSKVTIFGVEIPATSISTWGLFLIATFQLYFIIDVGRFESLNPSASTIRKFAWIGVYPGMFAKFIFLASSSIFPAFVAVFASIAGSGYTFVFRENMLVVLSGVAVVVLGILSGIRIVRFQSFLTQAYTEE